MQVSAQDSRLNAPVASYHSYHENHMRSSQNDLSLVERRQASDPSKQLLKQFDPRVLRASDAVPQLEESVATALCRQTGFTKDQLAAAWSLACQDIRGNLFLSSLLFEREDDFFSTLNVFQNRIVFKAFRDLLQPVADEQSFAKRTDSGFFSQGSRDSVASQYTHQRSSYTSRDSLASIPEGQNCRRSASIPHRSQTIVDGVAMIPSMDSPQPLNMLSPGVCTQSTTTPVMNTLADVFPQDDGPPALPSKAFSAYKDQKFSAENEKDRKIDVQCTYCGHTFASLTPLYTHEAEHHDAKFEYACPCCLKCKSNTRNGITKHLTWAHKDRDVACPPPLRSTIRKYKLACACGVCGEFFDLRKYPNADIITFPLSEKDQIDETRRRKNFLVNVYHQHINMVHRNNWNALRDEDKRSWHRRNWKRAKIAEAFLTNVHFLQEAWKTQTNSADIRSLPWDELQSDAWNDLLAEFEFHALRSKEDAAKTVFKAFRYLASCRERHGQTDHVFPSAAVVEACEKLNHENSSARPMSGIEGSFDFVFDDSFECENHHEAVDYNASAPYCRDEWPLNQPSQAPARSPSHRLNASMPPTRVPGAYINGTGHSALPQPVLNQPSKFEGWNENKTVLRRGSKKSTSNFAPSMLH